MPEGCPFQPRCRYRHDRCVERPPLAGTPDHVDACWLPRGERQELRARAEVVAVAVGDPGDATEAPAATDVRAEVPAGTLQERL